MNDEIIILSEDKMEKAVENVEKRFTTVRAGRANANVLDPVMVSYYGVDNHKKQMHQYKLQKQSNILNKHLIKIEIMQI